MLTRAYADWSSPVNAEYRSQLVARAVDLVQLFPAAAYAKNGADIRLAVDAVEDMFRLPDLTHVVIVAGDSDYVPLAQRCKRLGRYVVGIGVAGSTAKSLAAACDEFEAYDSLPGVDRASIARPQAGRRPQSSRGSPGPPSQAAADEPRRRQCRRGASRRSPTRRRRSRTRRSRRPRSGARARLGQERTTPTGCTTPREDADARMDPSFWERALGFRSFYAFLRSRGDLVDLDESGRERLVRLREA